MAYSFSPRHSFDLLAAFSTPDALATHADTAKAVSFVLLNQKVTYNRKHQLLSIKIGKWAVLSLYKEYNFPAMARVTKKLTEQYIGLFCILEKVGCLAYRLNIPLNWYIHPAFSVAKFEFTPTLAKNFFARSFSSNPPSVFVESPINKIKSFKIEKLLNKRQVKKGKGRVIEYLICWKGYGPKWDR